VLTKHLVRSYLASLGNNNKGCLSKHREDGIAKSSRNMTNDFECIIMKVCMSKYREECTAKESKRVKCYMVYYECMCNVSLWLNVFKCVCVWLVLFMLHYFSLDLVILVRFRKVELRLAMFCYVRLELVTFVLVRQVLVGVGYVWLRSVTLG